MTHLKEAVTNATRTETSGVFPKKKKAVASIPGANLHMSVFVESILKKGPTGGLYAIHPLEGTSPI